MAFIKICEGDCVIMKKKHPCGSDSFNVVRTGSDIRLVCGGCGRNLIIEREKLEKMIKKVSAKGE